MEVQRPQPGRDVSVDLILHGLPVDLFVTIRAASSRPGTDTHPHQSRTVLDGRGGEGKHFRNPVRGIHVCNSIVR